MEKKVLSSEVIKTGTGKSGKPWTLVKITLEGQNAPYTGFCYEKVPMAGEIIDVELYQEEYNGQMQDKFRLMTPKKSSAGIAEMAIKTEVARYGQEIIRKLDLIMGQLAIKDFVGENEKIRNQEPMKPMWETNPQDIAPEDIPF